jgi:hypothetical protein
MTLRVFQIDFGEPVVQGAFGFSNGQAEIVVVFAVGVLGF